MSEKYKAVRGPDAGWIVINRDTAQKVAPQGNAFYGNKRRALQEAEKLTGESNE